MFIFAPLKLSQYLAYIDNLGVKSFVLVAIALLVLGFTFRCMVLGSSKVLWRKVKLTVANLLATVTDVTNVTKTRVTTFSRTFVSHLLTWGIARLTIALLQGSCRNATSKEARVITIYSFYFVM